MRSVRRKNHGGGGRAKPNMPGFPRARAPRSSMRLWRLTDAGRAAPVVLLAMLALGIFFPAAAQDLRVSNAVGDASANVSAPTSTGRRVALIIANSNYPTAPLSNPSVDASLIADSLLRIGFVVTVKKDLDLDGFEQALSDFAETTKGADLALFYFSGHGFSVAAGGRQQNFLMATSANLQAKTSLALQQGGEPLGNIEETIIGHARATLIFIDACRNVPALATRGVGSRGFAPIDRSSLDGAYVVLSTREGTTAADGETGQGSPVCARLRGGGADAGTAHRRRLRPYPREGARGDIRRAGSRRHSQRSALGGVTLLVAHEAPSQPAAAHEAMLQPVPAAALVPPPASSPTPTAPAEPPAASKAGATVAVGPPPRIAVNDPGGEAFKECEECPEMVVVPAGAAMLGSPLGESGRQTFEAAPHPVEIGKPFAVGRYAVTFAQWDACYAEGALRPPPPRRSRFWPRQSSGDLRHLDRSAALCGLAETQDRPALSPPQRVRVGVRRARLPDPQMRLRAVLVRRDQARVGRFMIPGAPMTGAPRPRRCSKQLLSTTDPRIRSGSTTCSAMCGNGPQDCWNPTPAASPSNGAPVLSGDCTARATRGGSWADDPAKLRASARDYESVDEGSERIGFRVARDLGLD